MKHVHISAVTFAVVALYVIIFGFLWRIAAAKLAEKGSPFGDAMGFIY